ncbi:glycosyltransferase [Dyadobacter sp. NIV53]|uniref:glycosyltransferase n=1 Tax=Dyadobacter sp. NIV53 TaxID=2861765 RepID=UPI001E53A76C|nr:glycosyltransferase [Dyadobacter sp. NIV53]
MTKDYFFEDVTLLITHYNRSTSLEQLLRSFTALNCHFGDIVVSDDGSVIQHLEYIVSLQKEFNFRLVTTPKNKGLGNNINKGQDAVKSLFTLYVQEDFTPTALFPESFKDAMGLIRNNQEIDIVRFYAYFEYPYLANPRHGYYETDFRLWKPGYQKFYVYSDHPHLRRNSFFERFGRYVRRPERRCNRV